LAIGFAFLAALLMLSQLVVRLLGDSAFGRLLSERLLIVGWVAMWRPIEIFLYDWWPVVGEQRVYEQLSRIGVQTLYRDASERGLRVH